MKQILEKFNGLKVLVVGDVMLDAYLFGKVERISPEAPVPVVSVNKKETRLGGAANVAMNLVALGAKPTICSVIGKDKDGTDLLELFTQNGIGTSGVITSDERITTVKTRIMSQNHQMIRFDSENTHNLGEVDSFRFVEKISTLLYEADVLIFEDYDKGVLDKDNISLIIQKATEAKVPVAVDPKKRNFLAYSGATLFKPNLKELKEGFHAEFDADQRKELEAVAVDLMKQMQLKHLLITMSERGVMITDGSSFEYVPAHLRKISDVSGAGDTVISVAGLCLALGLPLRQIAELSNLAGGLVCEEVGVVPIDKLLLQNEIEQLNW